MGWRVVGNRGSLHLRGKGEILLTGRLGDWLKESARAALSCVRMRTEEYGLELDFYQKQDLHVHYPGNPLKTDGYPLVSPWYVQCCQH